ncbi:hypothetical protein HanXRQr2_Chr15g0707461 [Helianthus annuus]|uniref:Uncharacterized protein n=1 Tax=Helianthus annuus TaxID=4232 RepID=A0A9K3H387_HELAN|nr:hypothetical protein HanXRQr2_Chr15g0707461 [Helianthus annuus]KAJ0832456.1 hypothetical protein HanPSC8_Chr15g0678971 [Helianthus annuus]
MASYEGAVAYSYGIGFQKHQCSFNYVQFCGENLAFCDHLLLAFQFSNALWNIICEWHKFSFLFFQCG